MATSSSLVFSLLLIFISTVTATDHIVGGHFVWNPNINYSLWSNNQTFVINDYISFRYIKNQYNVFEVNKTGYDNCTMDGVARNWTSGKDFILLDNPKTYYFICGNGYCQSGMKVAVTVHLLPSNATAARGGSASAAVRSDGALLRRPSLWLVAAAALIGLRSGWI